MVSAEQSEWTLCEAARLLAEPQHRLIYLCEKGVIQPDLQDAEGRGSSRRFSALNLLEFGVSLRLRAVGIPAPVCGAVVLAIRGFEKAIRQEKPSFRLPGTMLHENAPELKVVIGDDRRLYFSLTSGRFAGKSFGGVPVADLVESVSKGDKGHASRKPPRGLGNEVSEGEMRARVEVSVTGIAQDLGLTI
jgi:hypothetical protein